MFGKTVVISCKVVGTSSVRYSSNSSSKKLLELLASMPKPETTRIPEAQRQRQVIAKRSEKYSPSTVYLQVLGSGARGAPNTLYVFTDHKRYLFNCGESTQRLAYEHKVKLSRLEHIFITSKTWRNIGGLPGLSLTLQDVGVPHITLHGPEGLDELYKATQRFIIMKDMEVSMAKCTPNNDFNDNTINVKYVLLGPHDDILVNKDVIPPAKKPKLEVNHVKDFEEFIHDDTDYYRSDSRSKAGDKKFRDNANRRSSFDQDPMKKKTEKVLHDLQKKSNCTVAYICKLNKRLGTLDLAKCVDFGVKPGPLLGQLKNGHDVVLPDGTLVLSKDVKTPDDPGPVFIVLEVPELSYLKENEFSAHFDNGTNPTEDIPSVVVHYTPPDVFNHPTYRAFMSKFGPTTRHLVLNAQNSCLGSEAVHRTQHKLHLLDPDIFPLLRDASVPAVWRPQPTLHKAEDSPDKLKGLEELKNKIALAQFQNIVSIEGACKGDDGHHTAVEEQGKLEVASGRTLTIFHLRPKQELDRSVEPKLHIQEYIKETMDVDGFVASLEHFRSQVEQLRYARADSKEYPKVVFLGTGSCIPSKTRNTSAIVLHVDENRSILLDCGEGTYGQLVRFYGPKRMSAFLKGLKAIYVSHLHADHHLGLISVLQERRQALTEDNPEAPIEPIYLLAPGQIYTWLSVYDQLFENIMNDFMLVPNQSLVEGGVGMTSAMLANIGVQQIRTCFVSHCPNAFGVAVLVDGSEKITYSGDTIPCDGLVKIGENSTLLIHEATMEDQLVEEARTKMHSTTSQAIEAGRRMNAQYTVLTHFSQRYARLPRLSPRILHDNSCVGIAFDNMQVSMGDLPILPYMYAPLQLMYAEHCVEMEMKATQRARQKEQRSAALNNIAEKCGRNLSHSRTRNLSPGSGSTSSAPAPRASYRESNASRLRQESKGMTVAGIVRSSIRSKSSSPTKLRSLSSTNKANTGDATLKSRSRLPSPESTASKFQKNNTPKRSEGRHEGKPKDTVATPRSVSATSNIVKEVRKTERRNPSGHVVDTRSKTLNTVSLQQYHEVSLDSKKSAPLTNTSPVKGSSNGYGKPLVTSLNTKLIVVKDFKTPVSREPQEIKDKSNHKGKSPVRSLRSDDKRSVPSVTKNMVGSVITKPLTNTRVEVSLSVVFHLVFWRLAHITATLFPARWLLSFAIIAVGVFFWTAAKGNPGRLTKSANANSKPHVAQATPKCTEQAKQKRGASASANRSCSKSPPRSANSFMRDSDISRRRPNRNITSAPIIRNTSADKKRDGVRTLQSPSGSRVGSADGRERQMLDPFRDVLNERLRQHHGNNPPSHVIGRPSSGVHSRSFKPQLEDIKSSFMLLNKKQEHVRSSVDRDKQKLVSLPNAKGFNEELRRQQLVNIKNKFLSKEFKNDFRYEKIEGLNWISWK